MHLASATRASVRSEVDGLTSLCSRQYLLIPRNCVVRIEWAYVEVINVCKLLVLKQTVKVQPDTSMHKNVKTLGYIPQKDGKLS